MDAARIETAIDEALARSVLYHAVTLGLRSPIANAAFAGWDAVRDAARLLDAGGRTEERLLPAVESMAAKDVAIAERLAAHSRLFGHSRGLVCPFETEYGAGGEFRQPQELADIAGTYLAFGLRPGEGGDERVDHAACECEFMDFLSRKEAFALASLKAGGDAEPVATVQGAARGFLHDHIGRFGRAFASRLMSEDRGGFHGALGVLLFRLLTWDSRRSGIAPGAPVLELRAPASDETPMACGRPCRT